MLNLKIIPVILCANMIWAAAKLEANYSFKSTINLKKYESKFVEVSNSRSVIGNLDIVLTHTDSKKENYSVKITSLDFDKTDSFSMDARTQVLNNDSGVNLNIHAKHSKANLVKAFSKSLESDLAQLIFKIDASSLRVGHKFNVSNVGLSCRNINISSKECELSGSINFVADKSLDNKTAGDDMSILMKHLSDVKSEMAKSLSDYDIGGYREFLDKCESLVKNAITSVHSSTKKEALVEVRRKIINERVDSYEYTAIRSRSIVGFVDTLIKLI